MNLKTVSIILGIVSLAAISFGQGQRGGMYGGALTNPQMLLQRDDVRTDLQLTDDQKSKLFDMSQSIRDRFTDLFRTIGSDPEARKKGIENIVKKITEDVNKILTTGQQARLREIFIQVAGNTSASSADVQKDLALTAAQKSSIADLMDRQGKATRSVFEKVQSGELQREDIAEIQKKNAKILDDEIGKLLTKVQKDKLKTLGGKVFVPSDPGAG